MCGCWSRRRWDADFPESSPIFPEVKMKHRKASRHFLPFWLLLTSINCGWLAAQTGTSCALSGTVTDTSGAVVSGASVTATQVDTKAERTGRTDAAGHYLFSQVTPGTY